MSRILAVDPGDVRIGLALSDPSGIIARPLSTLAHTSRQKDAEEIVRIAAEHDAATIVVGIAYDEDGMPGPQARKSLRLVELLARMSPVPVITWDESGSTKQAAGLSGVSPDLDAKAAAVILQDYLDAKIL